MVEVKWGERGSFSLWVILLVVVGFVFVTSSFAQTTIKDEVEGKFSLERLGTEQWVYETSQDPSELVEIIIGIEEPYKKNINHSKKSILIYPEYVVAIIQQKRGSRIEVLSHEKTYERHKTVVITHWGGLRNGSIGNPPTRGGGFGGIGK